MGEEFSPLDCRNEEINGMNVMEKWRAEQHEREPDHSLKWVSGLNQRRNQFWTAVLWGLPHRAIGKGRAQPTPSLRSTGHLGVQTSRIVILVKFQNKAD
jgi:hypothetical protein